MYKPPILKTAIETKFLVNECSCIDKQLTLKQHIPLSQGVLMHKGS